MRMDIVTSLNDKYTRYACVQLTSLLMNQSQDHEIHVYLLNSSLEEDNKTHLKKLEELHPNASIHFLQVDRKDFSEVEEYTSCWSIETYFRLQACELLPESVDKFLYLDVDTAVNGPLDELFEYNMPDEIEIVGAIDTNQAPFGDSRDIIFGKWINDGSLMYVCAGVTLWNLREIRKHISLRTYLDVAKGLNYSMTAPDQDLINYVHQGKIGAWDDDESYGVFAKYMYNHGVGYNRLKNKAYIIHYAGQKPWQGQYIHYDTEKIWWEYAKHTPFYCELLEEFMVNSVTDPTVYNTLLRAMNDKSQLRDDLLKSVELNEKMIKLLNDRSGN